MTSWGILAPEATPSSRRQRTLGLAAAVRHFKDRSVPGLGSMWFAISLLWSIIAVSIAQKLNRPAFPVGNAVEARVMHRVLELGAKAQQSPQLRGIRKMKSLAARPTFAKMLHQGVYVVQPGDDNQPAQDLTKQVELYLQDYFALEGRFARLMYGATSIQSRRNMHGRLNRPRANPQVLLAQSRVVREGLNLHEECRRVILLQAEWNPAIVEQQIGRVDRKNSRSLKDYRMCGDGEMPRIHIHPVVVSGTNDNHNWQVLKSRWRDLRAQLHGDIIPNADRISMHDPELGSASSGRNAEFFTFAARTAWFRVMAHRHTKRSMMCVTDDTIFGLIFQEKNSE